MKYRRFAPNLTARFEAYLRQEEKSEKTVKKYVRDVGTFEKFLQGEKKVTKDVVISYKNFLKDHYRVSSVNSMLAALNSFFEFMEWKECKVKLCKKQREVFCDSGKELTKEEYFHLVETARECGKERLSLILQTICSTGIRISELSAVTAEAVKRGFALVECKGKVRKIKMVKPLEEILLEYCEKRGIEHGPVFLTKNGTVVSRENVWAEMKALSRIAGIAEEKVYPHNLRHLFARSYYELEKDLVRLSDILGHSNIETTRIYTVSSGLEHENQLNRMKLIM